MDPATANKVYVLGDDYLKTLSEHATMENILQRMGGTLQDPTAADDYVEQELNILTPPKSSPPSKSSSQDCFESVASESPVKTPSVTTPSLVDIDNQMEALLRPAQKRPSVEKTRCSPFCTK